MQNISGKESNAEKMAHDYEILIEMLNLSINNFQKLMKSVQEDRNTYAGMTAQNRSNWVDVYWDKVREFCDDDHDKAEFWQDTVLFFSTIIFCADHPLRPLMMKHLKEGTCITSDQGMQIWEIFTDIVPELLNPPRKDYSEEQE
ncbi:MAG: hypothetical protein WC405_08995 [Syntrophales bacterium]